MLRAFGHPVAMCCDMLGVVGSSLKMVKFEPTKPNMSQHIATRWPNARNMLRPTMLRSFGRGFNKSDVTKTSNGERETGNREWESGNECTAVTRVEIQHGGQKKRKRNNLGKCKEVLRL